MKKRRVTLARSSCSLVSTLVMCAVGSVIGCTRSEPLPSAPDEPSSPPEQGAEAETGAALPVEASEKDGAVASAENAPRRRHVVAAIGDSLTDPRSQGGKYLELLAERCPESRFDNFGKGGDMINQMRKRLMKDVFRGDGNPGGYTGLLIFGGANDLYSDLTANRTLDRITGDLEAMFTEAEARGMEVYMLTVAPWGGLRGYFNERRHENTLSLNRWIQEQASGGRVDRWFDAYALLSCGTPTEICTDWALADRVHLNAEGHRLLGEALLGSMFMDCR